VKRLPETLGAVVPAVVFSPLLRQDLERVRGEQSVAARVRELEDLHRRYGLGVFRDDTGKERIGIERHSVRGRDDQSNIDLHKRLDRS
jgi:hypothetical protein